MTAHSWIAFHVGMAARVATACLGAGLALWPFCVRAISESNDESDVDCFMDSVVESQETWLLAQGLLEAIMDVESGGVPWARSCKGALGLMQLMPATARRFGGVDRRDPQQSLRGGMRYLQFLWDRYRDQPHRLERTIAAYNAGEGAVDRYGPFPPGPGYAETRAYVPKVLAAMRRANWRRGGVGQAMPDCPPLTPETERAVFLGDPLCRAVPPTTITRAP